MNKKKANPNPVGFFKFFKGVQFLQFLIDFQPPKQGIFNICPKMCTKYVQTNTDLWNHMFFKESAHTQTFFSNFFPGSHCGRQGSKEAEPVSVDPTVCDLCCLRIREWHHKVIIIIIISISQLFIYFFLNFITTVWSTYDPSSLKRLPLFSTPLGRHKNYQTVSLNFSHIP